MARRKTEQLDITWKVALYIRLSREDGNDESMSVSNQRKILVEYVEQHFKEDYIIYDMYIDDGNTGTDTDRPGFRRMEQDIRGGNVNCVMVKALSRAFRNIGDQSKFLDEFLPLYKARFISMGSPFVDTYASSRGSTGLEVPIYGLFNEQYAAATSEEVRKTFNTKRRNGEFIGAFAPYGYLKSPQNKNKLIIDEEAAVVVREIFDLFLTKNLSINGITRELNERGILCPAMYKRKNGFNFQNPKIKFNEVYWTPVCVSGILKNQMYVGDMVQGKQRVISYKIHKSVKTPPSEWFIVENTHEAIIDKSTFYMVQKLLKKDTRTPNSSQLIYPFSGFLRCNNCGRSLHRKTSKGIAYYYCRISKEAKNACTKHSIRESKVEAAVLAAIQTQINFVTDIAGIIEKIKSAPKTETKSYRLQCMLKQQKNELIRVITLTDSLYADWKNEHITLNEYKRMKSDLLRRQVELKTSIQKIQDDIEKIAKGAKLCDENPCFDHFIKHKNIENVTREVLASLVDEIRVHEGGEITIKFSFSDQYKQITEFIRLNKTIPDA